MAGRVYLGYTENSLRGVMDEVKFYDHALTSEQLSLLYNGQRVNDIPLSVTIGTHPCLFLVRLHSFLIYLLSHLQRARVSPTRRCRRTP